MVLEVDTGVVDGGFILTFFSGMRVDGDVVRLLFCHALLLGHGGLPLQNTTRELEVYLTLGPSQVRWSLFAQF